MKQEQKTHVSADALIQLLKGAKAIRWQLALGVVMSLALVVCALIIPTQMGALVQILIDYFDAPETGASVLAQLAPGLLALAGVYLLRAAISYGKMQLLNRAVSRYFTCNLRIQISDKIQRLPVSFVDHTPVGDILSRMTEDVSRIGGSLHTVLDTITGGFLQILAIAVVMFLQNWQLSLAVIAFMPVSIWLSAKIAGRSETYFHQMFKQSGELYSVVEEAYTNYATTKAYNLEEHCAKRHAEINDARRVSEAKATYLSAIVQPVIVQLAGVYRHQSARRLADRAAGRSGGRDCDAGAVCTAVFRAARADFQRPEYAAAGQGRCEADRRFAGTAGGSADRTSSSCGRRRQRGVPTCGFCL